MAVVQPLLGGVDANGDVEQDRIPRGLNEDTIRQISAKKNEPAFMLEWRLKAYRHWASLEQSQAEPKWANIKYPRINYQDLYYYSAPKKKPGLKSLDEVDPEILATYEKLGIPLADRPAFFSGAASGPHWAIDPGRDTYVPSCDPCLPSSLRTSAMLLRSTAHEAP